jgi:molybdopterin converting factor small subunit
MPTLALPSILTPLAGGRSTLDVAGTTVAEALDDAARQFPTLAPRLRGPGGAPYPFVTIYLNDEDIRFLGGFAATLGAHDELHVVPAVAGG